MPKRRRKKNPVARGKTDWARKDGRPLTLTPHNLSDLLQWEDLKDDVSYRSLQDQLGGIGITMNTILDAIRTPAPTLSQSLEERAFKDFLHRFYLVEARVEAMYGRMIAEARIKDKIEHS